MNRYGLSARQSRQLRWQVALARHSHAADEHGDDWDSPAERRRDFMLHEVALTGTFPQDLSPARSDYGNKSIAPPHGALDRIGEICARRNVVNVDENLARPECAFQPVADAACIRSRVFAPIADEDVAHPLYNT